MRDNVKQTSTPKKEELKTSQKGITIAPPEPKAPLPTIENAPKPREEQAP